jgi:hypothetical protein
MRDGNASQSLNAAAQLLKLPHVNAVALVVMNDQPTGCHKVICL